MNRQPYYEPEFDRHNLRKKRGLCGRLGARLGGSGRLGTHPRSNLPIWAAQTKGEVAERLPRHKRVPRQPGGSFLKHCSVISEHRVVTNLQ